ncbi:CDP-diacylglycerol--glycerol-3-phosphate 3-phosphatidyltransferase [Sinomonas atrocyanea]|uniref:CDP-diacylglycerol--glycerol-3-phosphate 3-phosphatidyltransferase n=1 Tax=Sinomonas atrocyanea TaxID=37927 RepID=A0A126ZYM2_9MICC|nr:CDP-alcohol phosphatidyltransferase family protein [Sinomonas atrocyanea]AMM32278.1 CDP-diacylglycerol--glycerol-3-phosphate 3-phosphatidyltransferase [Sinomonas atrocyanea]GEB66326.1 CDP-diacylglycerol--glycerol-3-phosphate 3-phosphatidyltransferase [Sinomonas atrocyanea]GGG76992.1 CDP-diacylglycerol--glycerol-3-phosphate 3-phosphatidyltransferase [Sinomonas atrocyanea]
MRLFNAGARPGRGQTETDAVLTLPNVITILRFLGVPLFMWLVLGPREYGWAVVVLAVMGSTDWVDGYIARRLGQTSTLGRVLDPAADRLALLAVALTLVLAGVVQWWYLAALLVPDVALGIASLFYFHSHPDLPVSKVGKVRTALLLVGTPLLVLSKLALPGASLYSAVAWSLLVLGLLGHWVAAMDYFRAIVVKGRPIRKGRRGDGGREAGR